MGVSRLGVSIFGKRSVFLRCFYFGQYFQFHGEWPIVDPAKNQAITSGGIVVGEKAPV